MISVAVFRRILPFVFSVLEQLVVMFDVTMPNLRLSKTDVRDLMEYLKSSNSPVPMMHGGHDHGSHDHIKHNHKLHKHGKHKRQNPAKHGHANHAKHTQG